MTRMATPQELRKQKLILEEVEYLRKLEKRVYFDQKLEELRDQENTEKRKVV